MPSFLKLNIDDEKSNFQEEKVRETVKENNDVPKKKKKKKKFSFLALLIGLLSLLWNQCFVHFFSSKRTHLHQKFQNHLDSIWLSSQHLRHFTVM